MSHLSKNKGFAALLACALCAWAPGARAQDAGGEGGGGGGGGGGAGGGGGGGGGAAIGGNPDLDHSGGGNSAFSEEGFLLEESQLQIGGKKISSGVDALHDAARKKGSIVLGEYGEGMAPFVPGSYTVKAGDTLYYLSAYFFGNPDLWPGIWSLNPEITNPNWIYPGQQLLLSQPQGAPAPQGEGPAPAIAFGAAGKPGKGIVYQRDVGFIEKDIEKETGKIIGAHTETLLLKTDDKVYIKYDESKVPFVGALLTVYEVLKQVKDTKKKKIKYGKMVRILGGVTIQKVDKEHKLAVGVITEALYPIERGALVGPVDWKFSYVEPVAADLDLEGKIIAAYEESLLDAEHDVVFVNLGKDDGLKTGNVLTVVRKRDPYKEMTKKKDGDKNFPWEQVGKLLVVKTRKKTATALVIDSTKDLVVGDKLELARGK